MEIGNNYVSTINSATMEAILSTEEMIINLQNVQERAQTLISRNELLAGKTAISILNAKEADSCTDTLKTDLQNARKRIAALTSNDSELSDRINILRTTKCTSKIQPVSFYPCLRRI